MDNAPHSDNVQDNPAEKLCDLLLELVGRNAGRMATARRHVEVLDEAVVFMTLSQRTEARRRISVLETKWGPLLPGTENTTESCGVPPVERVARWLSTRRVPERHLKVLHRAATKFSEGETSISVVMDHAFAYEFDYVLMSVGFDSFKEWMIELRIASCLSKGIYVPGQLCQWWVEEMVFNKAKSSAYHACLKQLEQLRSKGRW
jgi:hypothetical protein